MSLDREIRESDMPSKREPERDASITRLLSLYRSVEDE
jgi:hypothetical protein